MSSIDDYVSIPGMDDTHHMLIEKEKLTSALVFAPWMDVKQLKKILCNALIRYRWHGEKQKVELRFVFMEFRGYGEMFAFRSEAHETQSIHHVLDNILLKNGINKYEYHILEIEPAEAFVGVIVPKAETEVKRANK